MKEFISLSDLAINGAPPAFSEPLHVGRPNICNRDKFLALVNDIFDRRWLTNYGPLVKELELKLEQHLKVKHCIAMCNGTIALEIAIRALGMTGEVIIPSYTFIATAHALQWQEITPIFADINIQTHSIDPLAIRQMITPRTSGIIGVHLWGKPCDISALQAIADEHRLKLMFDASHAFSCSYDGTMIGNFGRCEVFSFHATKFFNTFEGGAIATNDDGLAKQVRLMKNFGFAGYDNVIYPGTNGKMTEICAAMGITSLEQLEEVLQANRLNYRNYSEEINKIPGLKIVSANERGQSNYQYVVMEVSSVFPLSRDEIIDVLHAENILARKYFWPGCHNMEPYRSYYPHAGMLLPNTKEVAERVLVLPTGSSVNSEHIHTVCSILHLLSRS